MSDKKWYHSTWFIVLSLIFIFPLGLYLMWKHSSWKKWLKVTITVVIAFIFIGNIQNLNSDNDNTENKDTTSEVTKAKDEKANDNTSTESDSEDSVSNDISEGVVEPVDVSENTKTEFKEEPSTTENSKPTREQKAALNKAKSYSEIMNMSKAGIYEQLTSDAGEQFPADAAQYAIDNLKADYNKNALKKAESYAEMMDMSTDAIYDQLVSDAGEKFTPEEAQYAVDHLSK